MNTEIEIIKDDLNMERFDFYFYDDKNTLFLNDYTVLKRASKRHSWKPILHYSRFSDRNGNMKESEVPLTEEIKQQALNEFFKRITVKKWSER